MKMSHRPLIQDLVKEAIAKDAPRIAAEGARQLGLADETTKVASSNEPESVSTDFAMKLASAVEFATPFVVKAANIQISGGGKHDAAAPPEGVSASTQSGTMPGPGGQGHGHAQPPKSPGMQTAGRGPATQMENTHDHHVAGTQTTAMSGGKGKVASILAKLASGEKKAFALTDAGHKLDASDYRAQQAMYEQAHGGRQQYSQEQPLLAAMTGVPAEAVLHQLAARHLNYAAGEHEGGHNALNPFGGLLTPTPKEKAKKASATTLVDHFLASTKVAEDAINPAQISAGKAVAPETSASGESGGAPVAGMPQGPRSLVHSNESAQNYKKNQAYAGRKTELRQYFNEPALTSQTDTTLQQAFAHTGEAGTKLSSAGAQVKTAAARAVLMKLAEKSAGKAG